MKNIDTLVILPPLREAPALLNLHFHLCCRCFGVYRSLSSKTGLHWQYRGKICIISSTRRILCIVILLLVVLRIHIRSASMIPVPFAIKDCWYQNLVMYPTTGPECGTIFHYSLTDIRWSSKSKSNCKIRDPDLYENELMFSIYCRELKLDGR